MHTLYELFTMSIINKYANSSEVERWPLDILPSMVSAISSSTELPHILPSYLELSHLHSLRQVAPRIIFLTLRKLLDADRPTRFILFAPALSIKFICALSFDVPFVMSRTTIISFKIVIALITSSELQSSNNGPIHPEIRFIDRGIFQASQSVESGYLRTLCPG